jgi:hypothetical protein
LALIQFSGRLYADFNVEVAFAVTVEHRHALVAYAKRGPGLGAFWNLQAVFSLHRRNHNFGAERGLRKRDWNHAVQVVAFALEEGVLFNVQDNIQIARRSAESARFAEAAETNARAVFHSRGNLGLDHALAQHASFAFALRARVGDDAARALAGGAGSRNAEEALLIAHLATSIARPAGNGSFAWRGSASAARVAGFMAADVHVLFGAKHRLVKFQMQVFAQVGSTLSAAAATPSLAEHVAKTKDVAKNVAEVLEDGRVESRCASAAHAGMAEAVVQRALLAVGKDCVRFRDLFEFVFRVRIIRIAVGMVGHRQLAVGALDLHIGSSTGDAKHLVKIAFRISGQKLPHFRRDGAWPVSVVPPGLESFFHFYPALKLWAKFGRPSGA